MDKQSINNLLVEHIKNNLSPNEKERALASKIYISIKDVLGEGCMLTGSYARLTSTTPINDIDILYRLDLNEITHYNPNVHLNQLKQTIEKAINDKKILQATVALQTHSITLDFQDIHFSVDIVPAIPKGSNDFGLVTFLVPEILITGYRHRTKKYASLRENNQQMSWILSDPLGYIEETKRINGINSNFRKVVKLAKKWKQNCKDNIWKEFAPKSFHIERILFDIFQQDNQITCIEGIFNFFLKLKLKIDTPQIPDRADANKHIDEYLNEWNDANKKSVKTMCDIALCTLEEIGKNNSRLTFQLLLQNLINPKKDNNPRESNTEQFMFDYKIPIFVDDTIVTKVIGKVFLVKNFFPTYLTKTSCSVTIGEKINFSAGVENLSFYTQYWKVKNDITTADYNQVRGEITKNHTRNNPESTSFKGNHYVECYIVVNNECVSYDKLPVRIV
jgi:hypothetical protein